MKPKIETFQTGLGFEDEVDSYPSRLECVSGTKEFSDRASSFYGFVLDGECRVGHRGAHLNLQENMYFALPGGISLGASGRVVVFQRFGYRCLATYGGPTEATGRLSYIDNCQASILVPPARLGDPVLNLLVFPPGIRQTAHVHPTVRLGVVVQGDGQCILKDSEIPLSKGKVFILPSFTLHCFFSGPEGMTVIAYHPESDVGPTDEAHPMKSRTYLQGK